VGGEAGIEYHPLPSDDPTQRQPNITRAKDVLGWQPKIELAEGLASTIEFFAQFDSASIKLTPKLEDTFGLYRSMMLGMVAVFQLPTLVFFLSLMRIVTARWLVRNIHYAIFASFVVAALLTASTDPWNQTIMAAPMFALYLISIVVAWLVGLCVKGEISAEDAKKLRLVVGATIAQQLGRSRRTGPTRA